MTLFQCLPSILLAINCIWMSVWISKLSSRINNLEHTLQMREWLEGINNGESPSDMDYLFKK